MGVSVELWVLSLQGEEESEEEDDAEAEASWKKIKESYSIYP